MRARVLTVLCLALVAGGCRATSDLPVADDASATAERSTEPLIDAGPSDVLRDVSSEECFAIPVAQCPPSCRVQGGYGFAPVDGGLCRRPENIFCGKPLRFWGSFVECWARKSDGAAFLLEFITERPDGVFRGCTGDELLATEGVEPCPP
ncbi:MAG: hypothetical protein IPG50_29940 [Myxococcales bacterium]|nr:hypothetical protein [Myxococcales bacterium]